MMSIKKCKEGAEDVVQVEHLPSMCEAMCSIPSNTHTHYKERTHHENPI
jgi:hypothetical protein